VYSVHIDPFAGFCPGVSKAINLVGDLLEDNDKVYSLGELVHCPEEMQRLEYQGLKIVSVDDVKVIENSTILIRAHGVTPKIQFELGISSNHIVDATCNIVHRLQQKVKISSLQMQSVDGQIVIYGKKKHPEVEGLLGYCQSNYLVVESPDNLGDIDLTKPICIFAQTTANVADFETFVSNIYSALKKSGLSNENVQVYNTICGPMKLRVPLLKTFAQEHDVIVFVAGEHSSNGSYLASIIKEENINTFKVSSEHEVNPSWFTNAEKVGITGGNSTPVWLLENVAKEVKRLGEILAKD
jgi:4-hydroxy-3-methylbut-2-enyl diphosphate reductase